MSNLHLFILCSFVVSTIQKDYGLGQFEIVSDLLPEECFAAGNNYQLADKTYLLPKCSTSWASEPCNKFFHKTMYPDMVYRPTSCAKNGKFNPTQCKGERTTGRCFCFDETGVRLFGQQWWSQAANMTCACSRRKAEMADPTQDNYVFYNTLHCNSMGNYEQLQCDALSGQCWCADEQTGDLASPVVPEAAMQKLPCYNSLNVGTQYLRQCENKQFAQKNIEYRLSLRGTQSSFGNFVCDGDGAYGVYTVIDGSAYCTWRDNTKIGSWQSGDDISAVNCNCARDTKLYSDAGKQQPQKCGPNGNYQALQGSGSNLYCIDTDGYKKSPPGAKVELEPDCDNFFAFNKR